jgi:benzoylsuccinyl-CoA thiolase BbsA subunit
MKMKILEQDSNVMHRDSILVIPEGNLDQAYLVASQCKECNAYWLPQRKICPECLSEESTLEKLSDIGTLYSFSTIHTGYPGFRTPYTVGYVDLPEGIRIVTQIESENPQDLELDMKLKLGVGIIKYDKDNTPIYGWKFRMEENYE